MRKILITLVTIVCLILGVGAMSTQAETYTGSCGTNATYSLNTSTGVLTISGSGAIYDYQFCNIANEGGWITYTLART